MKEYIVTKRVASIEYVKIEANSPEQAMQYVYEGLGCTDHMDTEYLDSEVIEAICNCGECTECGVSSEENSDEVL